MIVFIVAHLLLSGALTLGAFADHGASDAALVSTAPPPDAPPIAADAPGCGVAPDHPGYPPCYARHSALGSGR